MTEQTIESIKKILEEELASAKSLQSVDGDEYSKGRVTGVEIVKNRIEALLSAGNGSEFVNTSWTTFPYSY